MQSQAGQFVKNKMDQARSWIVFCSERVDALLSPKDNADKSQDHDSMNLVSNFESLLVEFQTLLIWSNPINSAVALTTFTCLYWIAVLWSPSLFSIVAAFFLLYHSYEMWTRYVWPEIRVPTTEIKENWTSVNPDVLSAPEIEIYLAKLKSSIALMFYQIADLRRRSHGTFCFLSISLLIAIYYLGKYIPGVLLVYGFAIVLFLTPGFLLYVLPNHTLEAALEFCNSMATDEPEEDEQSECNDLERSESTTKESTSDSSTLSPFNSHFDENCLSNENANSNSASDISDDFEIISETDLDDIELK